MTRGLLDAPQLRNNKVGRGQLRTAILGGANVAVDPKEKSSGKENACQDLSNQGEIDDEKYAVIGAGHGGKAMAAHLALMGFPVNLFNRTPDHVEVIKKRGGIELESAQGDPAGFGQLALVTSNIGEAIKKVDVIMIVLPSSAHRDIAKALALTYGAARSSFFIPRTCGRWNL